MTRTVRASLHGDCAYRAALGVVAVIAFLVFAAVAARAQIQVEVCCSGTIQRTISCPTSSSCTFLICQGSNTGVWYRSVSAGCCGASTLTYLGGSCINDSPLASKASTVRSAADVQVVYVRTCSGRYAMVELRRPA